MGRTSQPHLQGNSAVRHTPPPPPCASRSFSPPLGLMGAHGRAHGVSPWHGWRSVAPVHQRFEGGREWEGLLWGQECLPTRGKSSIPANARDAVCLVSACITLQGACCFPVHRPELFRWQVTYYIPSEKPGSRAQIGPTGSKITVTDTNHRDELLSLNLQG